MQYEIDQHRKHRLLSFVSRQSNFWGGGANLDNYHDKPPPRIAEAATNEHHW